MLKIIQIVENLDRGAVENWLVRTFLESRKQRPDWDWTFYCILGRPGRLDQQVLEAGGKIIYSPAWISDKIGFLKALRTTLKAGGYDIVHMHHDYLSGYYALATAGLSFKKRVLHVHNTDRALPVGSARLQKLLLPLLKKSAIFFSDLVVGISKDTLSEFIGNTKLRRKSSRVLYYGIDLKPYANIATDIRKRAFCKEVEIPENSKILLFVGRINELKNPVYVVDILAELCKIREDAFAVFIGKGDEDSLARRAAELDITGRIRLAGWRDDTADIMKLADVFVFPRIEFPKEGLGLVVVEAQAAGLPMLLSKGIVEDAIEIDELAQVLSLKDGLMAWVRQANAILDTPSKISREASYLRMANSKFELAKAVDNFIRLYEN